MKITASNYIGREQNPFSEVPVTEYTENALDHANFESTVQTYPVFNSKWEPVKEYSGEAEKGVLYNNCLMLEWPANIPDEELTPCFIISEPEKSSEPEPGDEQKDIDVALTKEESNRLIAEFMGLTWIEKGEYDFPSGHYEKGEDWYGADFVNYDTSWDWLMPCVEKIETLGHEVCITKASTGIYSEDRDDPFESICFNYERSKLQATYQAVIEFINYYNTLNHE